jgi:hypothetical protein
MKKECKHCKELIQYEKHQQFGNHVAWCLKNPNRELNLLKMSEGKMVPRFTYTLNCEKCNAKYQVSCTEAEFDKSRYRKTCSTKCSNGRGEKKKKRSDCIECGKEIKKGSLSFCSNQCQGFFRKKTTFKAIESGNLNFTSDRYKDYLIYKHGEKCMECGWNKMNSYTGKIPIQLEHIDGNSENNELSNLKLLCPNCHTLTPTWGGANKGNGRKNRRKK